MNTTIIIAGVISSIFLTHIIVLLVGRLRKDNYINQSVTFRAGKAIGAEGSSGGIMYDANNNNETVYVNSNDIPVAQVTSSFTVIYICLKQLETGSEYQTYLEGQVMVGRFGGNAGIQIADTMVSKKHCMIYRKGEQIYIEDLGSTNHTYLNNCMVQNPMPLCNGDIIRIGHGTYQFNAYVQ